MLITGSILQARYRIERVLGTGGMGAVYLATEESLGGKRVAIKEMSVMIDDPEERSRAVHQFEREARILATLDHPGLVDVTHYFEEQGKQYLVMAFIDGKTLEQILNAAKAFLEESQVVDWMDQVADVLEYLHAQEPPIIFRDMKPSNVMIDHRTRCRLIDFGIARAFDAENKTATFIKGAGTAGFAPLEQYGKRGTTDPRTDVYALGATTYTLLTRTIPPAAVDLALNDEKLVPPSKINPNVSAQVEAAIINMMAIKKEDRYQSMKAARQALKSAVSLGSDTMSFRRPRVCGTCGTTAPFSATDCPRCHSGLEDARLIDVDTVNNIVRSESTAVRQPPLDLTLPPKVVESSPASTEPRLPGVASTEPRLDLKSLTEPAPAPPPLPDLAPPTEPRTPPPVVHEDTSLQRGGTTAVILLGLIGVAMILLGLHPVGPMTPVKPTPTASSPVTVPTPPPSPTAAVVVPPSPAVETSAPTTEPASASPSAEASGEPGSPQPSGSASTAASEAPAASESPSEADSTAVSATPDETTSPCSSSVPAESAAPDTASPSTPPTTP